MTFFFTYTLQESVWHNVSFNVKTPTCGNSQKFPIFLCNSFCGTYQEWVNNHDISSLNVDNTEIANEISSFSVDCTELAKKLNSDYFLPRVLKVLCYIIRHLLYFGCLLLSELWECFIIYFNLFSIRNQIIPNLFHNDFHGKFFRFSITIFWPLLNLHGIW